MGPSASRGVSGYLEVFVLVAIAMGGAGLVFGAATSYLGAASGASATIASASIREGPFAAVEALTVSDTGTVPLGNLTLVTAQAPPGATYCYYVRDPASGATKLDTCPGAEAGAGSVSIPYSVQPGSAAFIVLVIAGGGFAPGSSYQLTVLGSSGAQASVSVRAVPA